MKVSIKTKGVVLTSKQKSQIEKKVMRLKRFVSQVEPVTVEISFLDENGITKGGKDQKVSINAILPKDKIFIEEVDDRALRAFQYAYKNLERRLRRYSEKRLDIKRRGKDSLKNMASVVGGAVGKIVPRGKNKK